MGRGSPAGSVVAADVVGELVETEPAGRSVVAADAGAAVTAVGGAVVAGELATVGAVTAAVTEVVAPSSLQAASATVSTSRAAGRARRWRRTPALYGPVVADEQQHPHDPRHSDAHPDDGHRSGDAHAHGHGSGHAHGHAHDHHQAPGGRDWAEFGARLEREGELVRPLHDELVTEIVAALGDRRVHRILDLGSGPGVASTLLAEAFPAARVTAVDASPPLLELALDRAARVGVGGRVSTTVADLEQPLDDLAAGGASDVVWASMVLHHVGGLALVLRRIHDLLAPGGVLALVEFGDDRRTLPADAVPERPGFLDRHTEVVGDALAGHLPPGALELDWRSLLVDAGFEVVVCRQAAMHRPAPLGPDERAFVAQSLEVSARLGLRRLDDLDLLTLSRLLDDRDPRSVARRDDLSLQVSRTLVVARRR